MSEAETPAEATTESPATPPAPQKGGSWVYVVMGLIVIVVIACVIGANRKTDNGSGDGLDAQRVCRDFVKARLKAPATAKFSGEDYDASGDTYTVTGAVDAQNSFGALLRSNYTCVVRLDGEKWRLQSVTGIS